MSDQDLYLGFDKAKQEEYEEHIIERYGKKALDESKKKTKDWKKENYEHAKEEYDAIHKALTQAINEGEKPSSEVVQSLMRQHFDLVSKFWTPNKESYVGLGQMYLEHEDFKKLYDSYHPQLASFLRRKSWFSEPAQGFTASATRAGASSTSRSTCRGRLSNLDSTR